MTSKAKMATINDCGTKTKKSDHDPEYESELGCDCIGEIKTKLDGLQIGDIRLVNEFMLKDFECKSIPGYVDVTCLSNGGIVVVDYMNSRCCFCNSSYQHLSDFNVSSKPWNVCSIDTDEVAIALPAEKKIQFLKVNNKMQPSGSINTARECVALVALSKKELVFCGTAAETDNNFYWGIITRDGVEKSCFHFSGGTMDSLTVYLALNSSNTRVYISCAATQTVLCRSLEGSRYFEYKIQEGRPSGIELDRQNNVYIVVHQCHSIHQLSPDGQLQRVFSLKVPQFPVALCFKPSSDEFVLTNGSKKDQRVCYVYELT